MKVLLYYPWIYLKGGVERVILETLKHSRNTYTVVTHHYNKAGTFPEFGQFDIRQLPKMISVDRGYGSVGSGVMTILKEKLDLRGYDVLLVHCDGVGNMITFRNSSIPCYCYCHTPLRPAYDLSYREKFLEKTKKSSFAFDTLSCAFRMVDRYAWGHYKKIFFNSQETKKRALRYFPYLDSKAFIINPGINAHVSTGDIVYSKFFLIAGRIMWTKNIELGIKSFCESKDKHALPNDFKLVIAGFVDKKSEAYCNMLSDMVQGRSDVEFIVAPSDEKLQELYRTCYAVIFTPFNEDWGMIPLEAAVFSKPTLAVNKGGPTESIVDGKTGLLREPDGFSEGLEALASNPDLNKALGLAAKQRSFDYDWCNFVDKIDAGMV
jgi:glycosyltransferase involved in cell wall biosynthesis